MDKIGYRGEITIISTLRNGKKVSSKYHNQGTEDLFEFLVNCLAKTEGVLGGAPRQIDVVDASTLGTILKAKKIINVLPVKISNKFYAEISAVITKSDLIEDKTENASNLKLQLYNGAGTKLAETDSAINNFLSSVVSNSAISAQVVWRMYFENVVTDGGNS